MNFTFGSHPFPAGTTVSVYVDRGQLPSGAPQGTVVTTAVVSASSVLRLSDLNAETAYYVIAQVGGVWLWVKVLTEAAVVPELTEVGVFNARDFGAVGDRITDDTNAFLECIEAAGAANTGTGATVFIPSGRYLLTDELVLPDGVSLVGASVANTALCWADDLGAGKYAIRYATADPWGAALEGLWIQGPGFFTAFNTVGEHPCEMRGVRMQAGGIIRQCQITSFDYNVVISENHEEIYNCKISGGYYNIYYDVQGSAGDQVFSEIQFPRALYAHVGINSAAQMGGDHWLGCHFADMPYAFYGEDGAGSGQMSAGSIFIDCAFEGWGNGCFYDAKRTRSMTGTFLHCGDGSGFQAGKIVANPSRATFDCYAVTLITDGGFPTGVGDDAVVYCVGSFTCQWDRSELAIANARTAVKPLVIAPQALSCTGRYSSGVDLCNWEMFSARNDFARGWPALHELVELQWDQYCQRYDATAGVPAGVTLMPVVGAGELVPVATTGSVLVKSSDATLVISTWGKPATDTAKRGELILATGPTDGPAVGFTRTAPSGGEISVRLRGLV